MNSAATVRERRDEILAGAARHGAGNVRLFGSVARGDDPPHSDIDLLIDVTGTTSPWFPGSLTTELEELLGNPVHVVIGRSLSSFIQETVLREAVPL
jgi:predicted nucleotidyltransferase